MLLEIGMEPNYQIIVDRVNNLDTIEIRVEMNAEMFSDQVKNISAIERRVRDALQSTLNIAPKVRMVEPKSIERSSGKAVRVIDNRKI